MESMESFGQEFIIRIYFICYGTKKENSLNCLKNNNNNRKSSFQIITTLSRKGNRFVQTMQPTLFDYGKDQKKLRTSNPVCRSRRRESKEGSIKTTPRGGWPPRWNA